MKSFLKSLDYLRQMTREEKIRSKELRVFSKETLLNLIDAGKFIILVDGTKSLQDDDYDKEDIKKRLTESLKERIEEIRREKI